MIFLNMQKIQISIILCIGSMCLALTYENSSHERLNDLKTTGNMWKNALLRNWIILNTHRNNHHNNNKNNSRTFNKNDFPTSQLHFQKEESHPNYFEYEQNTEDESYVTDVKIIEPYIVTISEMRAQSASVSDSSASFTNKITMPKDIVNSLLSLPQRKGTYNRNAFKYNESEATVATSASEKKQNNNGTDSFYDGMEAFRTQLNEMISPLQSTLNKFMHWCYISECLTDNDDYYDDNDDDNEKTTSKNDNDLRFEDARKKISTIINASSSRPAEVQGHEGVSPKATDSSLMAISSESTARSQRGERAGKTQTSSGRRIKKLKRKLSKLILPLLIAYKLKFLTLIPVLIGGLILLVGTTGLAGFFFALFTAVMSLKATAGKSIVIKKI